MIKYLEKLLNGREVEWKKLGDISIIYGGLTGKNKYDFENGNLKYIPYKNIYNNLEINFDELELVKIEENEKQNFVKYGDVLFTGSSENLDEVGLSSVVTKELKENIYLNSFSFGLRFNENIKIIPKFSKFLFRCMKIRKEIKKASNGVTRFNLSKEKLNNILIPIPPLDVQEEIVRVLDKFTDHTKELTKELTLRKKEYSYYRDYLLEFKNIDNLGIEVKRVKLSDIAISMFRGKGIKKDEVDINGDIACVRYGEIYTMYNTYFEKCISRTNLSNILNPKYIEKGDLLFAITGESIEDIAKTTVYLGEEKALVGGDILVLRHKQNPKYLSYALSTQDAIKQKMKGKVKSKVVHTNAEDIGNIEIFLPSLEIQERIVNVLDNFEKICNDLNIGLPKEVELRQKEYEYYRESILTNIGNKITLEDKTRQYNIIKIYQYIYGSVIVEGDNEIKVYNDGVNFDSKNNKYYSIEYKKLGDICDYEQPNKYIVSSKMYKEEYNIPVLTAGKTFILGYTNEEKGIYEASKNSVIIFDDFTTDNKWVDFDFKVKSSAMKIITSKNVNQVLLKYVYYWLNTIPKNNIVEEHKRQWISNYANKIIPIPPIEIQQKIVSKLDKLETIINSISYGLPKEIELRTKQYEYYREQLLTFDK